MKNVTPELIARAKTAQSAEELLALAKTNGIELTEETAKAYFEQLNANTAVADDELAAKLDAARVDMAKQIAEKEAKLQAELAAE